MWFIWGYLIFCAYILTGLTVAVWSFGLNPDLDKYQLRSIFITWPLVLVRAWLEMALKLIGVKK